MRGHPVLEIVGQRVDRADVRAARLCCQPAVSRLDPGSAPVKREVNPGDPDAGSEITTTAVARRAIHQVVGTGRQHLRVISIDSQRRLVNRVRKIRRRRTSDRHLGLRDLSAGHRRPRPRGNQQQQQQEEDKAPPAHHQPSCEAKQH